MSVSLENILMLFTIAAIITVVEAYIGVFLATAHWTHRLLVSLPLIFGACAVLGIAAAFISPVDDVARASEGGSGWFMIEALIAFGLWFAIWGALSPKFRAWLERLKADQEAGR